MQPNTSHLKNCTAAITQTKQTVFPWFAIQCDIRYEASYVCQDNEGHFASTTASMKQVVNHTCDADWFMIDGSDKCFTVLQPETALSYYDAQDACSKYNASLLRVQLAPNIYTANTADFLKGGIQLGMNQLGRAVPKYMHSIREESLPSIMLGKRLSPETPSNYLPHIISELLDVETISQLQKIMFYADINGTCSVVDRSHVSMILGHASAAETKNWGAKCRSCTERLNTTGVICEKESKPYINDCSQYQFRCNDGTCILILYICDLVVDCFDGGDEEKCSRKKGEMLHQTLKLPYLQAGTGTITEIQVHTICDGIYSNVTFIHERDSCSESKLKHIDFSRDNTTQSKIEFKQINYVHLINLFLEEKRLCLNYNSSHITIKQKNYTREYTKLLSQFKKEDRCSKINQLCIFSFNTDQCGREKIHNICRHVICPGMFKCEKFHCIHMSYVCDGQYDCKEGDDEMLCPLTSCPGLLKCRGENRCVSKDEICDNHVNCLYSMDDEIDCHKCPINCECIGYSVKCHLEDSLNDTSSISVNYTKGLTLTGVQRALHVQNLHIFGLIYINASFCQMGKIIFSHHINVQIFILIADFKYNELTVIKFLQASLFRKIVSLDLSFNHLSTIKYATSFLLTNLYVLSIEGNPLKSIIMSTSHSKSVYPLYVIDMRSISNYIQLYTSFSVDLYDKLNVIVSDSMMCCIFNKNIKCTYNGKNKTCMGLINNYSTRIIFYFLSFVTPFMFLVTMMRRIVVHRQFLQNVRTVLANNKKHYYFVILLNYLIAVMLIVLYFFGLVLADAVQVNVLFWTVSPMCLVLKLILYNFVVLIIVFKTALVTFLSLQIIYPFKHQCVFLKWTGRTSFVVWLIVSASCFLSFVEQSQQQDYLCSLGKCVKSDKSLLLIIACFINCLFVITCILPISKTYLALKQQKAKLSCLETKMTHSMNAVHVTMKIVIPIISELPFQCCLFVLMTTNLANVEIKLFCESSFLLALPVSVCFSLMLILLNES